MYVCERRPTHARARAHTHTHKHTQVCLMEQEFLITGDGDKKKTVLIYVDISAAVDICAEAP